MNVPKGVFRQYDVRGLVDRELTPAFARALGRAFASAAWDHCGHAPVLAVGRDNRPSGAALAAGFRQGIADAGGTAVDVGLLPTPALYFAVQDLGADGGCQVTGSHNPPEFNGFKMVLAGGLDARRPHPGALGSDRHRALAQRAAGGETADGTVLPRYRDAIVARHRLERPVSVVVDCGNGAGSVIAVETLRRSSAPR